MLQIPSVLGSLYVEPPCDFGFLISRTSCLIKAIAISDDSGVVYTLSHISWCLSFIAVTVSYFAVAIGKLTHCQSLSYWIAAFVQCCQWQHWCGGGAGECLPWDRRTRVKCVSESANFQLPMICSPWKNRCKWWWQFSC
jgi:hypothetical protein